MKSQKKKIGMVVAIELNAIFDVYPNIKEIKTDSVFKLFSVEREDCTLYIIRSCMGECAAAAACQLLISKYQVSMIINFGVVGGLTPDMNKQKVCLVDKVVHYKYDCSEFLPLEVGQVDGYDSIYLKTDEALLKSALSDKTERLPLVTCCSGDKFVSMSTEKNYLHEKFGGDICDMESAGIVLTCDFNHIPCILFKAVSDGLADGAGGFFAELDSASKKCLEIADKRIIGRISELHLK